MNPDQQGFYRPDQPQPAQPIVPPSQQPVQQEPVQPTQTIQPLPAAAPLVDQAALNAALAEPAVAATVDIPLENDVEDDDAPVTWAANEYIHQEKGTMWFIIFGVIIALLLGVSVFLMKAWSFAALLVVIAVVVVIYSRRPPRELTYSITDDGLVIDDKLHNFGNFKSFGVIRDGEEYSVMLIPTQRFQPGITVYFPEELGEDIVDMLGSVLPMKELKLDMVDRVVRLLRL